MLGRHPQLYGFPELVLFRGDTLSEGVLQETVRPRWRQSGLLRSVAELRFGAQDADAIEHAHRWIAARADAPVRDVFDELLAMVAPRRGVEKSPDTLQDEASLGRCLFAYPEAQFVHLVRSPRATAHSQIEHWQAMGFPQPECGWWTGALAAWCSAHALVLEHTRTLPPGRVVRVRAEDVLRNPKTELARVADELCLRSDAVAVEEMLHPERSPYAAPGPPNAPGGLDHKFLDAPQLRRVIFSSNAGDASGSANVDRLASRLARWFGYEEEL